MKKFVLDKKETVGFRSLKIILINAVLLAILLLIFTPGEKIDDYSMKFILAGAATGEYSNHLLYCNIFLGQALKMLTMIMPNVPWFEVSQYIVIFASFCVLVYLVQKRRLGRLGNAILLILLAVFGVEAYIKLTFTKTAAIAFAAGIFLLFSVFINSDIKKGYFKKAKTVIKIIASILLILVGSLYRFRMCRMIFGMAIVYFLFQCICAIINSKKENVKIQWKTIIIKWGRLFIVCIGVYFCLSGINSLGNNLFNQNEEWAAYKEYNSVKFRLQDYGWPDYDEYQVEYEELGISRADYNLWSVNEDYADPEIFTTDLIRDIINIKNTGEKTTILDKTREFFKEFPVGFVEEICFWAVLAVGILWCLGKQKYKKAVLLGCLVLVLAIVFYLYMDGVYDRHQVNVGMWFAIALILISCMEGDVYSNNRKWAVPLSIGFLCWMLYANFGYFTSASYYGTGSNRSVDISKVQDFLESASDDDEHLYVTSYREVNYGFYAYSLFEQIPAGVYHNIYNLFEYMYPTSRASLDNYGVYNVYREIVNNEMIYYYRSDDVSENELNRILAYIQENYKSSAYSCVVKQLDGFTVYGIITGNFKPDTENIIDISPGEDGVVSSVTLSVNTENPDKVIREVSGSIYKEGSNSFNQRVYLEVCRPNDGSTTYKVVTTSESDISNDVMNGQYGQVYRKDTLSAEDWDPERTYNIILECDDGMYRIPLEITEN